MKQLLILFMLFAAVACGNVSDKAKQTINKGGEVVGKTATEFVEGVSEGVDKTLQCDIIIAPVLQEKGLRTGKFSVNNDSIGKNNLLTLYIIFDKDFDGNIFVKATDKNGLEMGRVKMRLKEKAGDAKYVDFHFDRRTRIEAKSKISIDEESK